MVRSLPKSGRKRRQRPLQRFSELPQDRELKLKHFFLLKIIHPMRDGKNNAMQGFIIFVGSSPRQGDIFVLKSDIKWAFSYILNSCNKPQMLGQPQNS